MTCAVNQLTVSGRGIQIHGATAAEVEEARRNFLNRLRELGIDQYVQASCGARGGSPLVEFQLRESFANEWAPGGDTTQLCEKLKLDTRGNSSDLDREILLAMLLCPIPFQFPSFDELASAVRIRKYIVEAARKTALAFATAAAERPADYWDYSKDRGFVVVGVHTPELAHERVLGNVRREVSRLGITYPVVVDNDSRIWGAFHNQFWPAAYFADATGRLRFHHFGEGRYDEQDKVIAKLLDERDAATRTSAVNR